MTGKLRGQYDARIAMLYPTGLTHAQIAARLGCSKTTVLQRARLLGLKRPAEPSTGALVRMHNDALSAGEIAKATGLPEARVRRELEGEGLKPLCARAARSERRLRLILALRDRKVPVAVIAKRCQISAGRVYEVIAKADRAAQTAPRPAPRGLPILLRRHACIAPVFSPEARPTPAVEVALVGVMAKVAIVENQRMRARGRW